MRLTFYITLKFKSNTQSAFSSFTDLSPVYLIFHVVCGFASRTFYRKSLELLRKAENNTKIKPWCVLARATMVCGSLGAVIYREAWDQVVKFEVLRKFFVVFLAGRFPK